MVAFAEAIVLWQGANMIAFAEAIDCDDCGVMVVCQWEVRDEIHGFPDSLWNLVRL